MEKQQEISKFVKSNDQVSEWKECYWGDIAILEYGKSLRDYKQNEGNYPVYGTNGQIGWCDSPLVKQEGVIIGRKGAYRGVHYSKYPFFVIDTAFYLKPKSEESINIKFAYYELQTHDINSLDSGSAIPSTSRDDFYSLSLKLPPIEEQKIIVNILEAFDDKIDLNRQMNSTLEKIAQTLFKHWFIDFEFLDENGNPYRSSGGRMVDSELGEIPEGWEVLRLQEISKTISKGTTPSKKQIADAEGAPSISFIKVKDMGDDGQINREGLELIHESIHKGVLKRSILFENDLLFSIAGTIGRVSIVENDLHNSNINQAIAFIRLNGQEYLSLVLEHLKSKRIQEYAMRSIVQGVQANISLSTVGSFQILVPNDTVLTAWNKVVLSLHNEKLERQKQNRFLSQLRNTLLPRLMSGKIRVQV